MNALGIDFGSRRIGLSHGDDLGIALPLPALQVKKPSQVLDELAAIIQRRKIDHLVIGYPYNMDGSIGFKAREVDTFIESLEKRFRLPVAKIDERLTTHTAESQLKQLGRPTKNNRNTRRSGEIDSRAAALILQDFLDQQLPAGDPQNPGFAHDEPIS